jgi:cysteine desulfurase
MNYPTEEIIYLDNNATTKIDPRVLEAIMPFLTDLYGNPSSIHYFALQIKTAVSKARLSIADLLNTDPQNLIFTSGATESINLAIKGFSIANSSKGKHLISVQTEHKAVLDTHKYLETIGFEVSYLAVDQEGIVDPRELEKAIRSDTILISIMFSNNEVGVIQPMQKLLNIAKEKEVAFFTDATQAVGKVSIDLDILDFDLMAFSAHKFYGPKGIGCLYIKDPQQAKLETLHHGGGHESNLRSGTLNVPGIVGFARACEIAKEEMVTDSKGIGYLRDELEKRLIAVPGAFINGSKTRLYNITNICFPGLDANALIQKMKNVAISNGSACTSLVYEPSHVLKAIGLTDAQAMASLRFSLGRFTTLLEIEKFVERFYKEMDLTRIKS